MPTAVTTLASALLASALLVAAAGALAAPAPEQSETIFRDARKYTVRIRTQVSTPFIQDVRGSFGGAGFVVDAKRRWVLTNAHVVSQSPSTVQVAFADGDFRPARKVYVDSFTDVAVLEVERSDKRLTEARLDCDEPPSVGEGVGAFGHPLGMPFTGTRGIVSGLTDQILNDLIQIDATVDHGNSGGPVIALRDGQIVGIATAGAGGDKSDRLNFATPLKDVCRILDLLRNGRPPEPPLMEFSLLVDEDGRHTLEVGATHDPVRWPFVPGDVIVSVGSEHEKITTMSSLVTALRGRAESIPIQVTRGGTEVTILARPAWRPSVLSLRALIIDGALLAPIAFEDAPTLREPAGLVVHSVEPSSAAETIDIQQLDIVESVDGRSVGDLDALIQYVHGRKTGQPMRLILRRTSPSTNRWSELHVRELPGDEIRVIGPEESATATATSDGAR